MNFRSLARIVLIVAAVALLATLAIGAQDAGAASADVTSSGSAQVFAP